MSLIDRAKQIIEEHKKHIRLENTKKKKGQPTNYRQIFDFIEDNIEEFFVIDNPNNLTEGVYFIGNFYVGKSKNFGKRFSEHILDCVPGHRSPYASLNTGKISHLTSYFEKGEKVTISVLDGDMSKEREYINKLYLDNPLTNGNLIDKKNKEIKSLDVYKHKNILKPTSLEYLMNEVEKIAKERYGGHYCIYRFTGGFKACFYTLIEYVEILNLVEYKTLEMALVKLLEEEYNRKPL